MKFSITQFGEALDESKYSINIKKKTFSSEEDCLVLDFSYHIGWTFKTGHNCTFFTNEDCTFKTGHGCTFKVSENCIFDTGYHCTFTTGDFCTFDSSYDGTFNTGNRCTFDTGSNCTFKTGYHCTFTTGCGCTFTTSCDCIFSTSQDCTFNTGKSCTFLVWYINTCKFKSHDDISIILDRKDHKAYKLTKELIDILRIANG